MFVTSAYAEAANGAIDLASNFGSLWLFAVVALIMYFMIIRPQRLQMKKREIMLKNIQLGDRIVTAGGIIAKVKRVVDDNEELEAEIATGVVVHILRSTIADVQQ